MTPQVETVLVRGVMVAFLVRTLLTLINQFERVFGPGPVNPWKAGLSYLVPFCVSVFSGLAVKVPAQDEAALADESATSRAPSRGRRASLRRRLR